MRRSTSFRRAAAALVLAGGSALGALPVVTAPATSATTTAPYTVRTLHFKVLVGPKRDQPCDIVGDLYLPRTASPTNRVPALLMTNGFGGSKDGQAGWGKLMSSRGYAVLSYSGLGFGGSTCKITLDDPQWDGVAARQLVSFLGGRTGIAFTDAEHTRAVPALRVVRRDRRNHLGGTSAYDPRIGMLGGSYGGEIQFALASIDPRLDTIVPMITWNDLTYSLAPNGTSQVRGVSASYPGAIKLGWGLGFSALGIAQGAQAMEDDPERMLGCPNFIDWVCPALVQAGSTGYFAPAAAASARHASVASYVSRIRIPTLLMQGQDDTLFNLNEATATYRALKAQGTPVKMVWQRWGHSGGAAPGEYDGSAPNPRTQYTSRRIVDWFDHHLRGSRVSTGPAFTWFRDWVKYTGIATPAYARSTTIDVASPRRFHLSGAGALATSASSVAVGQASFVSPAAGAPTVLTPIDALGGYLPASTPTGELDGTYARWTSAPLSRAMTVVGSPTLSLQVNAPTAALGAAVEPGSALVLFVKVLDVAPDGTASTIHDLVAPVRVEFANERFLVRLPGIVHRWAPGHSLQLMVAGSDVNHRGGLVSHQVTISSGGGQVLTLPVVD